jgi:hypothetical protein
MHFIHALLTRNGETLISHLVGGYASAALHLPELQCLDQLEKSELPPATQLDPVCATRWQADGLAAVPRTAGLYAKIKRKVRVTAILQAD